MKISPDVAKEDFDKLLKWLAADRDEAGRIFEQIREGLIRYFRLKGCHEPEDLADEAMNRVTTRVDSLDLMTGAKPISVFYGFATRVFLEYSRSDKTKLVQLSDALDRGLMASVDMTPGSGLDCLQKCLDILTESDAKLIVEYYSEEKQTGYDLRRKLAAQNDMTIGTLQTKIHRIKTMLRPRLEKCINENKL